MNLRMPVLDKVLESAAQSAGFNGQEIVVLHVNHCMDNSFYFSEALKKVFYDVVFIGVPYNDREVEKGYSFRYYYGKNKKGVYELYRGNSLFETARCGFVEAVELLLEQAIEQDILPLLEAGKKLLIIEDGGYHYGVVKRMAESHPVLRTHILGSVEQTTSGTSKCLKSGKGSGFSYPCTSIARSDIKMYVESRFIGNRVVEELSSFLYSANTFLDFHNVLILGYGIVGRRVARNLQQKQCRITVYDTDGNVSRLARQEGFATASQITPEHFPHSTVVIGNAGKPSFTEEMLEAFFRGRADTLYLASSSSQDREFKTFLNLAEGKAPLPEGAALLEALTEKYFTAYRFSWEGREKTVYLIAQGMPVNFYRKDVISLTYSIIDLIFAEMLSMGLTLCAASGLENRLYLLGRDDGFMPFISEEELTRLWFAKYDLSGEGGISQILDPHPLGGYLREKLMKES